MARLSRSEIDASNAFASEVAARQALTMHAERERADWRAVLARRDAKRAHRSRRMARRAAGRSSVGMLATLATFAAALGAAAARVFGV